MVVLLEIKAETCVLIWDYGQTKQNTKAKKKKTKSIEIEIEIEIEILKVEHFYYWRMVWWGGGESYGSWTSLATVRQGVKVILVNNRIEMEKGMVNLKVLINMEETD